jgi:signal transduction histidine kinase
VSALLFAIRSLASRLFLGLALCVMSASAWAAPQPASGSLDLSAWNFQSDGSVSLGGAWRVYHGRWAEEIDGAQPSLRSMPERWTNAGETGRGYATYALTLTLPPAPDGERYAIATGYFYSAYRVYANGILIASSGVPSATADGEVPRVYSLLAPLPPGERTVDLRFEVSNHLRNSGGVFMAPSVGLESAMALNRTWHAAFAFVLLGAMLFAAAYHFLVFWMLPDARSSFWFGAAATVLAVRSALIEPLAPNFYPFVGQDWLWRINFAATMLVIPAVYRFFTLTFPDHVRARYAWPLDVLCGAGAIASLALGADAGAWSIKAMEHYLAPLMLAYLTYGVARAAWDRIPGAQIAAFGWAFSAATATHDILLDNNLVATDINLVPFGFMGFLLCLSGTLAARSNDTLRRTAMRNDDLEIAVADRTQELRAKVAELEASRVALEQARREAVSANVAKSRFLATMSHELRTPLNSILGFSDIIRSETLGPVGDDRYRDYAGHIHDSGSHLLMLIGDVLDISRIEAGKVELRREPLDLGEVCVTALRHAATRERRASEAVTTSFEANLPLVSADERAVMQMVINLVSNAMKFTPEDGRIALATRRRADGGVSVEVADSGVGMEAADIPKALALFSQVDEGHSRRHEGTGLGLPIVKSLIELHGGQLHVTSEKGKGTTVRLDFPAGANVASDAAAA